MTTVPHEPSDAAPEQRPWILRLQVPEMWASLAIVAMWLAVLLDALFGPDIVSSNAGANMTSIPSAIVVAFFAYLGTRVVAKYGFGRSSADTR